MRRRTEKNQQKMEKAQSVSLVELEAKLLLPRRERKREPQGTFVSKKV